MGEPEEPLVVALTLPVHIVTTYKAFLDHYGRALEEGDAALFVGAGLSAASGFVDWRTLLRDIAEDLGLSIDRESDLIALAQFHVNTRDSRARLNRLLIEEFTKDATITNTHRLLARLPVRTVWTTNYDTLLEEAFRELEKRVDVKVTSENLAITKPGRAVTIYKMHGDISQPQNAVLTKEDYETYEVMRELFTTTLKGDLVTKTFLFVGFSFTDPNIEYVLSRVRSLLGRNQREHYCIMRRIPPPAGAGGSDMAEYEYQVRKQDLRVADLRRYSIQPVLIDTYGEIERIFADLNRRTSLRNVLVSGSAHEYGHLGEERLKALAANLGRALIEQGYRLVSGFGLGLGSAVLVGALEATIRDADVEVADRLVLRPFPIPARGAAVPPAVREAYRRDMVAAAGAAIFIAGNKRDSKTGETVRADGVLNEFRIARELELVVIPVGSTGYVASEIWDEVMREPDRYYLGTDVRRELEVLGSNRASEQETIRAILDILTKVRSGRAAP